ncbi:Pdp3-interacting factor 1 [Exophiala dermatitidis]
MAPIAIAPPAPEPKQMPLEPTTKGIRRANSANMGTKRKIVIFSDFDGTIFHQDTGHTLFDNFGCGPERRAELAKQMESGERTFREVSDELYSSLNVPLENGFEVMKSALQIDPDFRTFHEFCVNNHIPFYVISAGLQPVLRKVLDHFIGEDMSKHIDIVANDVKIADDGSKWEAVWRHDNELGHDKAQTINEFREMQSENGTIPLVVFIGDGLSDLPAAREADVLFARRGLKLEEYCKEHGLPYIPFDTFADIQRELIKIAKVDEEQTHGKGLPAHFNPLANKWRRLSNKARKPNIAAAFSPSKEDVVLEWPEDAENSTAVEDAEEGNTVFAAPMA